MANWDDHIIRIVGPMEDIERFAMEFGIVSGAIDPATGIIADGWEHMPSINLGPGRYILEKCWVGVCDVQIEFESAGYAWPTKVYHALVDDYPTLNFQWRYCMEMGWGSGYIDATGDHRYHEEVQEGNIHWVAEEVTKEICAYMPPEECEHNLPEQMVTIAPKEFADAKFAQDIEDL